MANYAIGDIQGCYDQLLNLLSKINFKPHHDRLWLVGDLVNRGPASLQVLRFLNTLPLAPIITLGNHDLHLLAVYHQVTVLKRNDTFQDVLQAPDAAALCAWLQAQHFLFYDAALNVIAVHAGVAPQWSLTQALQYAKEAEDILQSANACLYLSKMYGNYPTIWSDEWHGVERWRLIVNYLTRMRFCDETGHMEFNYKGSIPKAPQHLIPWYMHPGECWQQHRVLFGHWAALGGKVAHPRVIALDTGCVWGGCLTALRLEDGKKFAVPGWHH